MQTGSVGQAAGKMQKDNRELDCYILIPLIKRKHLC